MSAPLKEYSDEWWDAVHRIKDEVESKVTALVDDTTKDVRPDIDAQVRMMISETYRFWRKG